MWRSLLMDSTTIIIRCLSEKATSCKRDKAKFLKSSKRSHQIAQDIQYDSSEGTPSTDDEDDETGRRGRVGMEGTLSERELVDYLTDMTNFSRLFLRGDQSDISDMYCEIISIFAVLASARSEYKDIYRLLQSSTVSLAVTLAPKPAFKAISSILAGANTRLAAQPKSRVMCLNVMAKVLAAVVEQLVTAREDTASEQWPTRPIGGVDDPLCTIGNDDIPRNGDAVFVWRCVLSSLQRLMAGVTDRAADRGHIKDAVVVVLTAMCQTVTDETSGGHETRDGELESPTKPRPNKRVKRPKGSKPMRTRRGIAARQDDVAAPTAHGSGRSSRGALRDEAIDLLLTIIVRSCSHPKPARRSLAVAIISAALASECITQTVTNMDMRTSARDPNAAFPSPRTSLLLTPTVASTSSPSSIAATRLSNGSVRTDCGTSPGTDSSDKGAGEECNRSSLDFGIVKRITVSDLFSSLVARCQDSSATVRTHAISAVQDVLEVCAAVSSAGQWEPGDRPVGTSVKCPGREHVLSNLLYANPTDGDVTGMSGRAEGSAMYMERGVVDVLRERLTDDKPTVRGKALSSLAALITLHGRKSGAWDVGGSGCASFQSLQTQGRSDTSSFSIATVITNEDLSLLSDLCDDENVSVRKQAVNAITDLLLLSPRSTTLQDAWVGSVLPLILDPEPTVRDSDVDSRSSSSSPTRGSSWALCSRISTSGRGELLKIAIESLLIAGDLKVSGARPRVTERSTSTAAGASSTIHAEDLVQALRLALSSGDALSAGPNDTKNGDWTVLDIDHIATSGAWVLLEAVLTMEETAHDSVMAMKELVNKEIGVESHISSGRNSIGTFGDYPTSPGLVTDEGVNGRINSQASNVNVKEGSESYSNSMASCSVAVASSPFGGRVSSSYNDSCSITGSGFVNAKDNETDEIRMLRIIGQLGCENDHGLRDELHSALQASLSAMNLSYSAISAAVSVLFPKRLFQPSPVEQSKPTCVGTNQQYCALEMRMKGLLERCFDVLHRFIFKSRPSATLFDNALPEGTVEDEGGQESTVDEKSVCKALFLVGELVMIGFTFDDAHDGDRFLVVNHSLEVNGTVLSPIGSEAVEGFVLRFPSALVLLIQILLSQNLPFLSTERGPRGGRDSEDPISEFLRRSSCSPSIAQVDELLELSHISLHGMALDSSTNRVSIGSLASSPRDKRLSASVVSAATQKRNGIWSVPVAVRAQAFIVMGKVCIRNYAIAKEYVIVFVRELLPSTAENTNQWRNVTVTVTAESVDQHQEGILRTTDDAMLAGSDSVAVRSNCVLILGDLCLRFTSLVEPHLSTISASLQDPDALVRRHSFIVLSQLLLQEYMKWRGPLLYGFLLLAVDADEETAELVRYSFSRTFLVKQVDLLWANYVEILILCSGWTSHPLARAAAAFSEEGSNDIRLPTTVSISGDDNKQRRYRLYDFMSSNLTDEQKIQVTVKLTRDILEYTVDTLSEGGQAALNDFVPARKKSAHLTSPIITGPMEACLEDTFYIMSHSTLLRVASTGASRSADEDFVEQEESNKAGSGCPEGLDNMLTATTGLEKKKRALKAAKNKMLTQLSTQHVIKTLVPILCSLKKVLEKLRSTLQPHLLKYLVSLMTNHRQEVTEVLRCEPLLRAEVEHEWNRHERLLGNNLSKSSEYAW